MKMKITLVAVAAIIALYVYGNHLRKKKKHMINNSMFKQSYEVVGTKLFTVEDMLKWYRSHDDVDDKDEYVLSRVTSDALKKGGKNLVLPTLDTEHSLVMLITDSSHKKIKHSRIVTYSDIEKDILDMLGNKNLIVLE